MQWQEREQCKTMRRKKKDKPSKGKEGNIMPQKPVPKETESTLPPGMTKRRVVTTKELAEALDVDPRTIVRAAKAGKIPAFRVEREFRFDPAAVRIALSNNAKSKK
jgi:excisionase family DNA binding protein